MTEEPERREKLADTDCLEKTVMEHFWKGHQSSTMPATVTPNPWGNLVRIGPRKAILIKFNSVQWDQIYMKAPQ